MTADAPTADLLPSPVAGRRLRCAKSMARTVGGAVTLPPLLVACVGWLSHIDTSRAPIKAGALIAVFGSVGIWVWTFKRGGLVDQMRLRAAARRVARRPDAPWTVDHRWDPQGSTIWRTAPIRARFGVGLLVLPLAVMFFLAFWAPLVLGGLVVLSSVWVWRLWLAWCRGRPHVAFTRFPYHPGEPVDLHFGVSEGGADFLRARFFLRRIQEIDRPEWAGGPECRSTFDAEYVVAAGVRPGPGEDVRLAFDVPADAGGTCLSAVDPSYWELEVVGDTIAGPFRERFLVPIYERNSAA